MSKTDDTCSICLKVNENLKNIHERDSNNVQMITKLECTIPDVEWNTDISICSICQNQLDVIYHFRKMCIQSHKLRSQTSLVTSENDMEIDDYKKNYIDFDVDDTTLKEISDCEDYCENVGIIENADGINSTKDKSEKTNDVDKVRTTSKIKTTNKQEFECPGCSKRYATKNGCKRHEKICKNVDRNINADNSEVYGIRTSSGAQSNSEALKEQNAFAHEELELNSIPSNTCSVCGSTFSNKYLLKRHIENVHASEKKFTCEQCSRKFASAVYLSAHMRYHSRERSHICAFCGKGYITASDLYHHEKIHANKRSYRCEQCSKAFNTSSDLHKHKICVHLDRSQWKYICTYCERRFPLKTNLDTHTKTHTGEKKFACHVCDHRCINRSVLMRHVETHSNVKAYKCNTCLQAYKYKKSLDYHLSTIHGFGEVPVKVKKYFCNLCPKSYFVNNKLQKHMRTHTGDKPFKCHVCQKGFVDKSYVKHHLKVSHGITDWNA